MRYFHESISSLIYCRVFIFLMPSFSQETSNKWKFAFQLDNRFSSIRGKEVTVFGGKVGVQYRKLTRFGLGGSIVMNPVYIEYFNRKVNAQETNKISFWYVSIFNDWILYKNKKWECFATEQVGFGRPNFTKEINNDVVSDVDVAVYVNEISGQVNYKIVPWIGVGAGIGHRNLLNKKSVLNTTFDAPIYIAKIILYPDFFFKKL
ncbi:hypothetical protein CLV55_106174 [Flavobacterium aciduliphilum]|uniref:Outer membrane protein with beta-barrel domain n=2 Tax=Flavobacterium aciduliphilum TaxID=1101402 RepID=A0A328YCQ7_9FLAO|nr:hypothetical protein CLV55_106174 [Flavobacterium aciduliphilum]